MQSLEGRTLGQYRLIEQVGVGGMAVIFKAYDPSLDRYVAIKILPEYLGHGEEFSTRFRNEARNVARLHHPNILPIYGYGEEDGLSYFVMGLVEGGTLKDRMGQPMDPELAVHLITQLADALHYAHDQGIVHRDVKPANVLMSRPDWPLLSDFGIARVLEQKAHLTQSAFLGTPHYMAPEQARGEPVSPRTDQYALGIVLYEMLTGAPPFQADTPQAVVYQHIYASLPLPHERNPNVSEPMERVILKALAKDPADRFPDMKAFAKAARDALTGQPQGDAASAAQPPGFAAPSERRDGFPSQNIAPPARGPSTERIETPLAPVVLPVAGTRLRATEQQSRAAGGRRPPFPPRKPVVFGAAGAAVLALALLVVAVFHGIGSGTSHTLLKVTVDRGSAPALTLLDAKGNYAKDDKGNELSDVTPDQARQGISVPQGKYSLQFASGSGYNGSLPVTLDTDNQTVDLSRSMSFFRIVPARDVPLQGANVSDSSGTYQFSLSSDAAGKTEALPPGRYLLTFNDNGGYLDDLRLRAIAGSYTRLDLARRYARVKIAPPKGAALVDFQVSTALTNQYLHQVTALQAQQGVYMLPGRYIFDFSGSNTYPEPLPVTVHRGPQTIHLSRLYGGLSITSIPRAGLTGFEVKNLVHQSIDYTVAGKDALPGIFLRPGKYLITPNSNLYMAPIPVTVRPNARIALNLKRVYGDLSVVAARGAPLSSVEVDDSTGSSIKYLAGSDVTQHLYLLPGRYTLKLSTNSSSASYLDPLSITIAAGKSQPIMLQSVYAGVRIPAAPGSESLSYTYHDRVDNTAKTVNAGSIAQLGYVRPGTYRIEVTLGSNSRVITIAAPAGKIVALPSR